MCESICISAHIYLKNFLFDIPMIADTFSCLPNIYSPCFLQLTKLILSEAKVVWGKTKTCVPRMSCNSWSSCKSILTNKIKKKHYGWTIINNNNKKSYNQPTCASVLLFASWWNTSHSACVRDRSQTKKTSSSWRSQKWIQNSRPVLFTSRLILYEKYIP